MKQESKDAFKNLASLADLVARAGEAAHPGVQVGRPGRGLTSKEYAVLRGVSVSAAGRHLNGLVAEGKYEMIEAIAPTTYGMKRITKQMFFREVQR